MIASYELFLMDMVLIYSNKVTPRARYVFDWIFEQWGIKYTYTEEIEEFIQADCPRIFYADKKYITGNAFRIEPSSALLNEEMIFEKQIEVSHHGDLPRLFPNKGDAGFDLFGAVFFMLSRYEEYLPFEADRHGRYPAGESLAFKYGFLEIPVVDLWLKDVAEKLKKMYPQLAFCKGAFAAKLTYDIDTTYKYLGRSVFRNFLAAARDLVTFRWKRLTERLTVLVNAENDPWDVYSSLQTRNNTDKTETLFFFLGEHRTRFDRNFSFDHKRTDDLLRALASHAEVGLHPSYFSALDPDKILKEKKALERKMKHPVKSSRQHFLKFSLPYTFNYLIRAGIRHEYSMLYPDAPGFRAGTCRPFYFYDLKAEKQTGLKIFPGCWMDSTFIHYRIGNPEQAFQKAIELIKMTEDVGGMFIPIFHNSHLSDPAWLAIHDELIKEVTKRSIR